MSALFASLLPYILMAGAALVALLGYGAHQKSAGRKEQVAKQQEAEIKARHTADEVDNDIGAMSSEHKREALKQWSPK